MIETNRLRLEVADYRAVHKAEIVIGDITVLSGVNACGKSTIAHLFHSLVNLNRDYEHYAVEYAWHRVRSAISLASIFQDRILRLDNTGAQSSSFRSLDASDQFERCSSCEGKRKVVDSYLAQLSKRCEEAQRKSPSDVRRFVSSFMRDIKELCTPDSSENDADNESFEAIANLFRNETGKAFQTFDHLMSHRARCVWQEADYDAVKWVNYPGEVKLYESDKCVCHFGGEGPSRLSEILDVGHAFYIESPWRNKPAVSSDGRISIDDGFFAKAYEREWIPDKTLFEVLAGEITEDPDEAAIDFDEHPMLDRNQWMYAREDGHEPFPLEECATGIKSLSILNFLYTRNFLGNKTLLIIDEPEAHLHPQWILEYAKILVRLNRRLGVRLLITTHSPGMLDAIRRVANVEEVPELRFYLAEEVSKERKYDFVYRDLGRQVEPIFAKFNLASDRTEAYPDELT